MLLPDIGTSISQLWEERSATLTCTRYPTAVGPKPVSSADAPSLAMVYRAPDSKERPLYAGLICMRVFTTSIAGHFEHGASLSAVRDQKTYGSLRHELRCCTEVSDTLREMNVQMAEPSLTCNIARLIMRQSVGVSQDHATTHLLRKKRNSLWS